MKITQKYIQGLIKEQLSLQVEQPTREYWGGYPDPAKLDRSREGYDSSAVYGQRPDQSLSGGTPMDRSRSKIKNALYIIDRELRLMGVEHIEEIIQDMSNSLEDAVKSLVLRRQPQSAATASRAKLNVLDAL